MIKQIKSTMREIEYEFVKRIVHLYKNIFTFTRSDIYSIQSSRVIMFYASYI